MSKANLAMWDHALSNRCGICGAPKRKVVESGSVTQVNSVQYIYECGGSWVEDRINPMRPRKVSVCKGFALDSPRGSV